MNSPIVRAASPGAILGLVFAGMPLIAALFYPTFMHQMAQPWVEWTRLLEFPFVAAEIGFILWSQRRTGEGLHRLRSLPTDVKVAAMLLLIGLFVSSLLISRMPVISITISLCTLVHLRFGLAVFDLALASSTAGFDAMLWWMAIGLIPLTILTAWRFNFPVPASTVPGGVIEWASALPGFISVRHFGSWTGAIAAGLLASLLFSAQPRWVGWRQVAYVGAAALTVWSGTRGAIFGMAVAMGMLALLGRRMPSFRAVGIAASLTGLACVIAWIFVPSGEPAFLLWTSSDGAGADVATGGRLALWAATVGRWLQSPVFGWGSGSTFWEVYVGWAHTQPHNFVLQGLISWGIVGAAGALWLLSRAVVAVSGFAAGQQRLYPALAVLFCLLAMSLIEGMLHYPRFIEPIFTLIAMLLAARQHAADASGAEVLHAVAT